MGLQFRKRTKGKNSWINISHSKKNGLSASLSVKLDKNLTMNFGGKGNRRATINFGNGFRYVKYRTPKGRTKSERSSSTLSYNTSVAETPSYTREELLESCKQALIDISPTSGITYSGDIEVIVELYNAIDLLIDHPDDPDVIDLMYITTNLFLEVANKTENQEFIKNANIIRNSIHSFIPKRPTPTPRVEHTFSKPIVWGTVIGICLLIAMCSA